MAVGEGFFPVPPWKGVVKFLKLREVKASSCSHRGGPPRQPSFQHPCLPTISQLPGFASVYFAVSSSSPWLTSKPVPDTLPGAPCVSFTRSRRARSPALCLPSLHQSCPLFFLLPRPDLMKVSHTFEGLKGFFLDVFRPNVQRE